MKRTLPVSIFSLFLILFMFFSGRVYAQVPTPSPTPWIVNGKTYYVMRGHLNARSGVDGSLSNPGLTCDTVFMQAMNAGLNFIAINDSKPAGAVENCFSGRLYCLLRGVAFSVTSDRAMLLPGYRWTGNSATSQSSLASMAVVGSDKLAYYSASGAELPISADNARLDFLTTEIRNNQGTPIYTTENQYRQIVEQGTSRFRDNGQYLQIVTALDQYMTKWQNYWDLQQPPYRLSLSSSLAPLVPYPEKSRYDMRSDMDAMIHLTNGTTELLKPRRNFDELRDMLKDEAGGNKYVSAMFLNPVGSTPLEQWCNAFFQEKFTEDALPVFSLAQVNGAGTGLLNTTLYATALLNGWKVAPATSLNNEGNVSPDSAFYYTGIWTEKASPANGKANLLNILESIRNRRTFVSNVTQGYIKYSIRDGQGSTLALMGDTLDKDTRARIHLEIGFEKALDRFYVIKPVIVAVFKNKSIRFIPFSGYSSIANGNGPGEERVDRIFERKFDSLKNIRCIYVVANCYRIMKKNGEKDQYNDSWSYYKLRQHMKLAKNPLNYDQFQIVSSPIYVDI